MSFHVNVVQWGIWFRSLLQTEGAPIKTALGNTASLPTQSQDISGAVGELYTLSTTAPINFDRLVGPISSTNVPIKSVLKVLTSPAQRFVNLSNAELLLLTENPQLGEYNALRLAGGDLYTYNGGGKRAASSYTPIGDHTPSYTDLEDVPTSFTSSVADVPGLAQALDTKLSHTALGNSNADFLATFNTALAQY